MEVAPGKFVLRCEHNVPGTNYPNPKSLQGGVGTTTSGVEIGHQDIETPLPGQPDHFQFIIKNWATDGQVIEGPTQVTQGRPYWTEFRGVVRRGNGRVADQFYLTGLRHAGGPWQTVGVYIIIK